MDPHQDESLNPSELGTKEYWDTLYERELQNHDEDPDDEGTIWFIESNAERAVLKQLDQLAGRGLLVRGEPLDLSTSNGTRSLPRRPSRFLDLGTGNGHMLFSLLEEDDNELSWLGELIGVDYSASSIQLARQVAAERFNGSQTQLRFEQWDLLEDAPGDWLQDGFDVVLDKGTFDAISLMPHDESLQHPCNTYREKVIPLVKPGNFLLITSCNWTRDELIQRFTLESGELEFHSEAKYQTFTFGGKSGQSVVTVVFRRQSVAEIEN